MKQVILIGALAAACFAQNDADTIIRRSVEANAADWKAAPDYDYLERDVQQGGGTRTYEELMILGSPYERPVAVNGKPLSAEQQAQEQQKYEAAIVERQRESEQERAKRIAKYEKERKRDHLMMEQVTRADLFNIDGLAVLPSHVGVAFDVHIHRVQPSIDQQRQGLGRHVAIRHKRVVKAAGPSQAKDVQ